MTPQIIINLEGLGWTVRLRKTRKNHFITIMKELVIGNCLKPGDPLYYYLTSTNNRKAILIMLDGKPLNEK